MLFNILYIFFIQKDLKRDNKLDPADILIQDLDLDDIATYFQDKCVLC